MKIELSDDKSVIIGKRVTVGAAINGVASIFAYIFPEQAPAIISAAVPLTLVTQVFIANYYGVTK